MLNTKLLSTVVSIVHVSSCKACTLKYKGRSINKLQNSVILLVFQV